MMFGNDLPTQTLGSMDIKLPIAKGCCNEQLPPLQTGRVREELPTVYDEALSYQEAIASILEKVNQLVVAVNNINLKQIADIQVVEVSFGNFNSCRLEQQNADLFKCAH